MLRNSEFVPRFSEDAFSQRRVGSLHSLTPALAKKASETPPCPVADGKALTKLPVVPGSRES